MENPALDWRAAGIRAGADVPDERRVTRDNWRLHPFSSWAFQHVRELVPSRAIRRAEIPTPLTYEPIDLSGLRFAGRAGESMDWTGFLEATHSDAVLVLHRGKIAHETYLNNMGPRRPHHLFSISKSFIGLIAEILMARGSVRRDDRVGDLLPELAVSAWRDVTLGHLLDMTDGVSFGEEYDNPASDVHLYSASYWTPATASGGTLQRLRELTRSDSAPGSAFRYRTPPADVVGWMLRRATGMRLADLLSDLLWRPAGCSEDAFLLVDTAGDEIAGSGLNATTHDLARIARMMIEAAHGQEAVLPAAATASLAAGGDPALLRALSTAPSPAHPYHSYRSFWWIRQGEPPGFNALGVFGQRLHIEPEHDLAFIKLGASPVASNLADEPLHRRAFDSVRNLLC